jgi:hypothetical protein
VVTFALLVVTDGRRAYLVETMRSLRVSLQPWPPDRFLIDDSGDPDYRAWLQAEFPDFVQVGDGARRGFAATLACGWGTVLAYSEATHIWHAEDDFTYNELVDLPAMAAILDRNPHLAQLALKRQPVNDVEREAGGFMETRPGAWTQRDGWIEHQTNFTSNPSQIPARVARLCVGSDVRLDELTMSDLLMAEGYGFGYLGRIEDRPRVTHIGGHRMEGWRQ